MEEQIQQINNTNNEVKKDCRDCIYYFIPPFTKPSLIRFECIYLDKQIKNLLEAEILNCPHFKTKKDIKNLTKID